MAAGGREGEDGGDRWEEFENVKKEFGCQICKKHLVALSFLDFRRNFFSFCFDMILFLAALVEYVVPISQSSQALLLSLKPSADRLMSYMPKQFLLHSNRQESTGDQLLNTPRMGL